MNDGNPYRAPRFDAPRRPAADGSADLAGPLKLFVGLTAIAATSYTLAMMVMMVALIGMGVCFLWTLAGAVLNRSDVLRRVLYVGVLLAMLPVGSCVLYAQHALLELRMQPLLASLERYRESHGSYPETLGEVDRSPPRCNALGGLGLGPSYRAEGAGYSITCITVGFNHHTYDSGKQRWRNWD